MGNKYTNYIECLKKLNIGGLNSRRKKLCLKFARNSLKNDKVKSMFPTNITEHKMKKETLEKFKVNFARTKRYKKSAIPYMVKLMNEEEETRKIIMK